MRTWHVVCVQPNQEGRAQVNLRRQRFECVWLKQWAWVVRRHQKIKTLSSMFPGYLFVALNLETDQWRSILGTFGVSDMIMAGEQPAALKAEDVDRVFRRVDASGVLLDPKQRYKPGTAIRIIDGPFQDFLTRVQALDRKGRVEALVEIMGRKVPVRLDERQIEAA